MAGEWRSSIWGDEISLKYGKALRDYDIAHGKFRVYGSNGPIGWTACPLAPGPGVILGRKGAYRGVEYSPDPFFVIDTAYYVVPKTELDMRWLYYAIKHYKLGEIDDGSPIPSTTRAAVYVQDLEVPPINEQRAIAHILGTLDDKIQLNRRMNETLEAMARALFKSWFVDFEPVRAKMEGRWRKGESLPGLPAHLYDLFPDSFEESELGEIPRGWQVQGLDEIANFLNGLALQKYPPGDGPTLPVIKIAQLRKGGTDSADRCTAAIPAEFVINDGDILFSWSGSLECILWAGDRGALNQHLFKVTSTRFPKWFYYLWVHEHLASFRHTAAGKATTMGHIQRHHLSDAKVVVPESIVLGAANKMITPTIEQIIQRRVESRALTTLRDTMLPKFVYGQLRVAQLTNGHNYE